MQYVCTVENCERTYPSEFSQLEHSRQPHVTCEACGKAFIESGLRNHQYHCIGIEEDKRRPLNYIRCGGHGQLITEGQLYLRTTGAMLMRRGPDSRERRHPKEAEMRLGEQNFCSSACVDLWMSQFHGLIPPAAD